MSRLTALAASTRAQAAIGVGLLALIVFLLVMSSRTGQREFDAAKRHLDRVETLNVRIDGALFMLMFERQTDFDALTALQQEMRGARAELQEQLPEIGAAADALGAKLEQIERFKSAHAAFRNSKMIATQSIEALRAPASAAGAGQELLTVERALLEYNAQRDPGSAAALERRVQLVAAEGGALTRLDEWPVLESHVAGMMVHAQRLGEMFLDGLFVDVPQTLTLLDRRLSARLADATAVSGRYRTALFAVAVLLLVFSGAMAARIRGYLRTIERANDELEDRVARRTEELAGLNAVLLKEIAQRESVESQLRIAQKLESIGQLAAGIAHEINTPAQYVSDNVAFVKDVWQELTPVLEDYERRAAPDGGHSENRAAGGLDPEFIRREVPQALEQAEEGLAQISSIVRAIRDFSHPGKGELESADLNRAVESTVAVARNEWKYVAEMSLELDPDLPELRCDVSALNQVVLNLVVNAAQSIASARESREPGRIVVRTRRYADRVEIAVEDNGPGIPEEIRDRIFDPFYTTKEVGKGTGQGLAIAHRIVHQQHGGKLSLETPASGVGARFVICLPRDGAARPHRSGPAQIEPPAAHDATTDARTSDVAV